MYLRTQSQMVVTMCTCMLLWMSLNLCVVEVLLLWKRGRSSGFLSNISVSPIYATGVADFLMMIKIASCRLKVREPCPLKIRNMGRYTCPIVHSHKEKVGFIPSFYAKKDGAPSGET